MPNRSHRQAEQGADDADSRDPQGEDGGVDRRVSRRMSRFIEQNLGQGQGHQRRSPAAQGGPEKPRPRTCVSW